MRARLQRNLRRFSTAVATATTSKSRFGVRTCLFGRLLPCITLLLAAAVFAGLGFAFSQWRAGAARPFDFLAASRGDVSAPARVFRVGGAAAGRAAAAAAEAVPPPFLQPPAPPSRAASATGGGFASEEAAFLSALVAAGKERANALARMEGLRRYAPLLPAAPAGAPPPATLAAAGGGGGDGTAAREPPQPGSPCGYDSVAAAAADGVVCAWQTLPSGQPQCCCAEAGAAGAAAAAAVGGGDGPPPPPPPPRRFLPVQRRAFTCLPSLVIAGAQKAGSTALFGYLLAHPGVAPAARKETHFFDRHFNRGLGWYLSHMPPLPMGNSGGVITAEATPSYALGVGTPGRLARALPAARAVLLLREPAARAYSEWNMKARRVEAQVRHDDAAALAAGGVLPSIHGCLAEAWAPLAPLLAHGARAASAAAPHEADAEALLAQLSVDPVRDAAVVEAVGAAWVDAATTSGGGGGGDAQVLLLGAMERWAAFAGALASVAAGRGSGGGGGGGRGEGVGAGRGAGRTGGAPPPVDSPPPPPLLLRGAEALRALLRAHWDVHAANATDRCLRDRALLHPGLAALSRGGPRLAAALRGCLLGAVAPVGGGGLGGGGGSVLFAGAAGGPLGDLVSSVWGLMVGARAGGGDGGGGGGEGGSGALAALTGAGAPEVAARWWPLHAAPAVGQALLGLISAAAAAGERARGGSGGGDGESGGGAASSGEAEGWEEGAVEGAGAPGGGGVRARGRLRGRGRALLGGGAEGGATLPRSLAGATNAPLAACFAARSTLGAFVPVYEAVAPFEDVVAAEAAELAVCTASGVPAGSVAAVLRGAAGGATAGAPPAAGGGGGAASGDARAVLLDGSPGCWPTGSSSNIAKDFLYRSVYLRQVARVAAALGGANVLVLPTERLRREPQAVLDDVCAFAGLPRINATAVSAGDLAALVDAAYPTFGAKTGWRMDGEYAPMDARVKAQLEEFFAPHNRALFEFLGVPPFEGWRV
jgi:hypothetical protein